MRKVFQEEWSGRAGPQLSCERPSDLDSPALCVDVLRLPEICANGKEDQPDVPHAWRAPDLRKQPLLETVLGREEMGFRG